MHLYACCLQDALGDGYLFLRFLAEADADGVADAVDEQRTDAHCALQPAVLALASFRHAQVQRIVHAFLLHLLAEQADALHHDHRVRGLNADHDVAEPFPLADAQEFHTRLHDALGRIAVARHDAVGEASVIHADADGRAVLATYIKEAAEALVQPFQLLPVLLVGIFQGLELTGRVDVVARIDAHFLHDGRSHVGHVRIEVDVGTERHVAIAAFDESGLDVAQVLRLACTLCGEANQLSARLDDAYGLLDAAFRVERGTSGHTLHSHGVFTADAQLAYLYFVSLSSHHIIYDLTIYDLLFIYDLTIL